MTTLTTALILIGTLCAAFGTLTWLAMRLNPDVDSMRLARRIATTGRWTTTPGLLLYLGHGGTHGTPMITVLLIAALAALASIATKTPDPANPAGNWPIGANR